MLLLQLENEGFVVGTAGKVLENLKKEQIATKVPIEGSFAGSHTDVIEAIWEFWKTHFFKL